MLNQIYRFAVQLVLILLLQQLAENRKLPERLSQVVTGRMCELPEVRVGSRQFLGLPNQGLLRAVAVCNVCQGDNASQELVALAPQRARADQQRERPVIGLFHLHFEPSYSLPAAHRGKDSLGIQRGTGHEQLKDIVEPARNNRTSRKIPGGLAAPDDYALRVDDHDRFPGLRKDEPGKLLFLENRFISPLLPEIARYHARRAHLGEIHRGQRESNWNHIVLRVR